MPPPEQQMAQPPGACARVSPLADPSCRDSAGAACLPGARTSIVGDFMPSPPRWIRTAVLIALEGAGREPERMVRGARCPCQPIKPLAGSLSAAGPEQFVTEYAHQPALPSGLVPAQLFGEPRVHA